MPGFLYFLPTPKRIATAEDLVAAGLSHALNGPGVEGCHTFAGPSKAEGVVVVIPGDGHTASYKPDEQTWRKGPGGKYWVGYLNGAKPGPDDLLRPSACAGTPVRLLDGNDWVVPRCQGLLEGRGPTLPRILDLAEDAQTTITRVHPRYARLCEDAFEWWMEWSKQKSGKERLSTEQKVQLAVDALAANYRVGKVEVIALLSLWGTDEFGLVLRALIDADEIEAWHAAQGGEKKTRSRAGGSATSSGAKESSPTTPPASPT